jgi:hypothetical protein
VQNTLHTSTTLVSRSKDLAIIERNRTNQSVFPNWD